MIMTSEQIIYDLQKQVILLEKELLEAQIDSKDFEILARTWMNSYNEDVRKLEIKVKTLESVIIQLEKELLKP